VQGKRLEKRRHAVEKNIQKWKSCIEKCKLEGRKGYLSHLSDQGSWRGAYKGVGSVKCIIRNIFEYCLL
jgi:hypothetical protein